MRIMAASLAPGPASVFVRTMVSYCSVIHRLDAMAGDASSFLKFSVRFVLPALNTNQSAAVSLRSGGPRDRALVNRALFSQRVRGNLGRDLAVV